MFLMLILFFKFEKKNANIRTQVYTNIKVTQLCNIHVVIEVEI